jgi:flagellin
MSVVNTNVKALFAQEASRVNELKMNKSMERLSTGLRINSAKDDAAGLAITNNMTSQIRGMAVAVRNANDGISMSQTAEGAYGEIENMLQRIRELAVQAANGAMSDDDRESLQLEVDELITQIDKVADTTNHNNIKLLDGSARGVVLQVGTKEGDTMEIGFDSAKAKDLGQGSIPMVQSTGGTLEAGVSFDALASGDLIINGVVVGPSLARDDTASPTTAAAASAISKVAAINRVSEASGVYARVLDTVTHGSAMTAATGVGTITINGVTTGSISTTTDAAESRARVVAAINAISGETGVSAVDTNDDAKGVLLVAADGRNIVHHFTVTTAAFTAATTGLGAAGAAAAAATTTVGTYGLYTLDGRDIVIDKARGAVPEASGLNIGTYSADLATYSGAARTSVASGAVAATTSDAGVLSGDTLVINDIAIGAALAADDTKSSTLVTGSSKAASAIAIAAAINKKTDLHGVTAVAEKNVLRGNAAFAAGGAALTALNINGVQVLATGSDVDDYTLDDIVNLVNTKSDSTGVVARNYNGALELTAEDGRNILIDAGGASAANLGLAGVEIGTTGNGTAARTHYASVRLVSDVKFTVRAGSEGNEQFERLGFREGSFGGDEDGKKVAQISVSNVANAGEAMSIVDAAIEQVSAAQAKAGAFQNRLDYVVSNLSEASQNMSASRSRILDADYATETTELARAQIIQQAATAMLAQANQSAQGVLALLQ